MERSPRRSRSRSPDRRGGGYDDRRGGGYDDRRGGGYDDRRGGGYDDRRSGGYDDRRSGGYDNRRDGGYDDRQDGGYDDRRGGGYDDRRGGSGGKTPLQQLAERETLCKPTSQDPARPAMSSSSITGGRSGVGSMILPSIQPRPGAAPGADVSSSDDWKCPACANWNWGKRKNCNVCNASRSGLSSVKGSDSGTTRAGAAGGFKEVDAEEDARRRTREEELKRERDQVCASLSPSAAVSHLPYLLVSLALL